LCAESDVITKECSFLALPYTTKLTFMLVEL